MVKRLLAFLRCFANGFATGFLHPVDTLRSLLLKARFWLVVALLTTIVAILRLSGAKIDWSSMDYGKPSDAGDDEFKRINNQL